MSDGKPLPVVVVVIITMMVPFISGQRPDLNVTSAESGPYGPSFHGPSALDGSDVFIENRGQIDDDDCLFYTSGNPHVRVHGNSVSVHFVAGRGGVAEHEETLRIEILGHSDPVVRGAGPVRTLYNYYLSFDEDDWVRSAPSYDSVLMEDAYPGISLSLLMEDGWPKYEIHCEPWTDPSVVRLMYIGPSSLSVREGRFLDIGTGSLRLTEGPLKAFQGGPGNEVECCYMVKDGMVSFEMGHYDPSSSLVIDPLLKSSTYIGGNSWDRNAKVKGGPGGGIYLVGSVESYDLYTHGGSYERTHQGERDVYICRMNADLSSMLFATYIGGSLYDDPAGFCFDGPGNVIVTGLTNSSDFPTTLAGMDRTYNGGGSDAFVSCFDPDLGTLRYSTYVGGTGKDQARDVSSNSENEPIVLGITYSDDIPVSPDALQGSKKGEMDMFVLKLSSDLSKVRNWTYLGGSSWGEAPYALEVDGQDRPVISGHMASEDYPTTPGAFQTSFGYYMGFVTKLNGNLTELAFSTFFGNGTWIRDMALDADGHIYLTGRTVTSADRFPVTVGAYDTVFTGEEDAFIAKLSSNGSSLLFSSYLGADENYAGVPNFDYYEGALGITLLDDGRPVVCGYTDSTHFPATSDAFDRTRSAQDAFITIFNRNASSVDYSTFLGGSDEDSGTGVAFLSPNVLYLAGETYSNYPSHDFPTTSGAYDTTFSVGYDMFLASFKTESFLPGPPTGISTVWGNSTIELRWGPPLWDGNETVLGYRIYRGTNPNVKKLVFETPSNLSYTDINLTNGVRYYYSVKAFNVVGEGLPATASDVPLKVPGPPVLFDLRTADSSLNLTYNPPVDRGGAILLTYRVFISEEDGPFELIASDVIAPYYNATGLINGRYYELMVSALNPAGEGPTSAPLGGVPRKRPGPPTLITVSPSDGGAVLAWDGPEDIGGAWNLTYRIYGGKDPMALLLLREGLKTMVAEIRALTNGEVYYFLVSAVNEKGEGPPGPIVSTNPLGPVAEPWNLTAVESGDSVDLNWSAPNSTGGYSNLTYEVRAFSGERSLGTILEGIDSTHCTAGGLTHGKEYTFSVRAFNTRFFGPWSDNVTVIPYDPPGRVIELSVLPGDGTLNLSWKPPSDDGGDPDLVYEVHFGIKNDSVYFHSRTNGHSVTFSGLRNGKTYYMRVRAGNVKGLGPFSELAEGIPLKEPSAPERLKCDPSDRALNISWERPGDDGGDPHIHYTLLLAPMGENLSVVESLMTSKNMSIDGLSNGLEYQVAVIATNSVGPSLMATTKGTPMTYPGPPEVLNATWEGGVIVVRWLPPKDDGGGNIWTYNIFRGEDPSSLRSVAMVQSSTRSWTDTNVLKGRDYYYSIRAENPYGPGPMTGPVKARDPGSEGEDGTFPYIYLGIGILMVVLVVFIVVMFLLSRKGRPRVWEE